MKLLVSIAVAVVAVIIGFAAGLEFEKLRHARVEVEQLVQSDFREQRGTAVVGLAALDTLEAGDTDKAKSLLARDIGVYYHAFKDREASLPQQQCLIPLIDEVSSRSSVLRAELQKEPR